MLIGVVILVVVRCPERFTHDVIALSAFGIDVDSIGAAARGEACPSFDAMESATSTLMALNFSPMKM